MKRILVTSALFIGILFSNVNAALFKNRTIHNFEYGYHFLYKAIFDRDTKNVTLQYRLFKDADHYASAPQDYVKTLTMTIPFSEFTNTDLLAVKNICESMTKRSILNESEIETNFYYDAVVTADATIGQ